MGILLPPCNYGLRKRFKVVEVLWKHLHTHQDGWWDDYKLSLPFMKIKMLKQCSSSIDPKTWHIVSLASFTCSNMPKVNTLELDINNRMRFKWLHSLPSFFKISKPLWSMVVLNREAWDSSFNLSIGITINNS